MSQVPLAPPPPTGGPLDGWLYLLWRRLTQAGQVLWASLDFTGSNLTDIATRDHADLQNLNTASYSHLTATQLTDLTDGGVTTLHSHSSSGGGAVPNVISAPTTISAETSYLVMDHLTINDDLTVDGYLGVTDLGEAYGGTVTTLSIATANGFSGTVANATTAPEITLSYSGSTFPAGIMFPYGGASAPSGWLLCDGSAVSRATYSDLFTAISTTFGVGDGTTTFNLPDTARKVLVGAGGTGTATLANTVGATGGAETHTLTTAELSTHSHGVTDSGHSHGVTDSGHTHTYDDELSTLNVTSSGASAVIKTGPTTLNTNSATTGISINSATTGISTSNAGSGTAHNNMQPSLVTNYIIKT
jgi:microcystin-dependent protein